MIRVNLGTRKQASYVAGERGGGTKVSMNSLGDAVETFKELNLKKALLPLLVAGLAYSTVETYKNDELKKMDTQLNALREEKQKLSVQLAGFQKFIKIRKSLESDELLLRRKIEVIRTLLDGRGEAPKTLEALSNAIPKDVWIEQMEVKGNVIALKGMSVDFGFVSDFMRALKDHPAFESVSLKSTELRRVKGEQLATFNVEAVRK